MEIARGMDDLILYVCMLLVLCPKKFDLQQQTCSINYYFWARIQSAFSIRPQDFMANSKCHERYLKNIFQNIINTTYILFLTTSHIHLWLYLIILLQHIT